MAPKPDQSASPVPPRRDTSIERRYRQVIGVATMILILALVVSVSLVSTRVYVLVTYLADLLLVYVAMTGVLAILQRRLRSRLAAADVAVEWLPIKWTNKTRDLDVQMRSLGFEALGAYQIVSRDGSTVFTSPVPVMATPDNATIAMGTGPLSFVSDLADGRVLTTSNTLSVDHPRYIRQYFIRRPVHELHTEHQKAITTLHRSGIPVAPPAGGLAKTIDKVTAMLQDQGLRPELAQRPKSLFKKDYVDPELVDVPMRLMATAPDHLPDLPEPSSG